MNCRRCQHPLEDPSAKFCTYCGASIAASPEPPSPSTGAAAPGWTRSPEPVIADGAAGPSSRAGARCAVHTDRPAVEACARCGTFACRECLILGADGQGLCSACHVRLGGETAPLPWERRSELGFFKAYWETTKKIMFNPNTAFDRVEPETGKWWDPLSYAILSNYCGTLGIVVMYAFIGGIGALGVLADGSSTASGPVVAGIALGAVAGYLVLIPLAAVLGSLIMAGIDHVALMLIGAQSRSFETTLRTYCFAQAPMFWGIVPFCGSYAYPVWQIVCRIFGYKTLHRTTGGKATAAVLLPAGLCCAVVAAFYGALFFANLASTHQ